MKFLIAIVIILGTALIGSKITFLKDQFSFGFKNILLTGTEYILIGLFLGNIGLGILDTQTLGKFKPFLIFGLAWTGYLYGMQFEIKQIKKLPKMYFTITAIQSIITFITVATSISLLFFLRSGLNLKEVLSISVILGIIALSTAQSALAVVNRYSLFKCRKLFDLLRYISSVDGLFALLFFSLFLSVSGPGPLITIAVMHALKWIFLTVFSGIIPALIFFLLNKSEYNHSEFILLLIGIIAFTGGYADHTGISPLISGLVAGIFIANTCKFRIRALTFLHSGEKAIYIILLLILGAGWNPDHSVYLYAVPIYIISRIAGKISGNFIAVKSFRSVFKIPPLIGLSLLSEGGISFGILVNFKLLYPETADKIIFIIIISALMFELLSPKLILTVCRGRIQKVIKPKGGISDEK